MEQISIVYHEDQFKHLIDGPDGTTIRAASMSLPFGRQIEVRALKGPFNTTFSFAIYEGKSKGGSIEVPIHRLRHVQDVIPNLHICLFQYEPVLRSFLKLDPLLMDILFVNHCLIHDCLLMPLEKNRYLLVLKDGVNTMWYKVDMSEEFQLMAVISHPYEMRWKELLVRSLAEHKEELGEVFSQYYAECLDFIIAT